MIAKAISIKFLEKPIILRVLSIILRVLLSCFTKEFFLFIISLILSILGQIFSCNFSLSLFLISLYFGKPNSVSSG